MSSITTCDVFEHFLPGRTCGFFPLELPGREHGFSVLLDINLREVRPGVLLATSSTRLLNPR